MKNHIISGLGGVVAAGLMAVGGFALPLVASAQGFSPVINAWTAGIPLITYGFGNAYGAPAAAYYSSSPYGNYGVPSGYGVYGGYSGGYGGYSGGYAPQYQPSYYGGYNQAYMPNVRGGSNYGNYGAYAGGYSGGYGGWY